MEIIAFVAGVASLTSWYGVAVLLLQLFFRQRLVLLLVFVAGYATGAFHEHRIVAHEALIGTVLPQTVVTGKIVASLPSAVHGLTFQCMASHINGRSVHALLMLTCYDHCPQIHVGERWTFSAKLKRPQNLGNLGGHDKVAAFAARHVHWVGVTRRGSFKRLALSAAHHSVLELRQRLASMLTDLSDNPRTLGLLKALTLGLSDGIDQATWSLFRRTGTTHLMVISGAHIGLVAGGAYALSKRGISLSPMMLRWFAAQRFASCIGIFLGVIYAVIAGLGIPAQRALIMCCVYFMRHFIGLRFSAWQAWRFALFSVVIVEPHSLMLSGCYLSFTAVAILMLMNQRVSFIGLKKMACLQLGCLVGLMPMTLYLFSYGSINGFFANALAIPWVSFMVIPLGLMVTLTSGWLPMHWGMDLVSAALDLLLVYLHWIDGISWLNLNVALHDIFSVVALMLALFMLLFLPLRPFYPAILVMVGFVVLAKPPPVPMGDVLLDVLDVQQGLAVVIRTANHTLVYDTGVKFYHGSDMGELVLIPYLRHQGVRRLDQVVISHPDLDHRGGLVSLMRAYAVTKWVVDDPHAYSQHAWTPLAPLSCHAQKAWRWDGVEFRFFPIIGGKTHGKNNASCVLQVKNQAGAVLLTGDIERPAEVYLAQRYGHELASAVLLVPHHGSKTSSTQDFVRTVAPHYALNSYGFDNRYHFPHREAMNIYAALGVTVYGTPTCGYLRVHLRHSTTAPQVSCSGHYKGNSAGDSSIFFRPKR